MYDLSVVHLANSKLKICQDNEIRCKLQIDYNWTGNKLYGNALTKYIHYGKYLQLITVILVPIVAVAFLNVSLICLMRNRVVTQRNRSTSNNSDYRFSFYHILDKERVG